MVPENVSHDTLVATIRSCAGQELLRDVELFDIYRPQQAKDGTLIASGGLVAGEKSMAVRLNFYSDTASLTDLQIDPAVQALVAHVATCLGARLRA